MQIISVLFLTTLITVKFMFLTVNIIYFCSVSKLDNADEQAAQIRRELDGRLQLAEQMARVSGCFQIPKTYLHLRLSGLIHSFCFQFLILKQTRRSSDSITVWQMPFFLLWRIYVNREVGRKQNLFSKVVYHVILPFLHQQVQWWKKGYIIWTFGSMYFGTKLDYILYTKCIVLSWGYKHVYVLLHPVCSIILSIYYSLHFQLEVKVQNALEVA